MRAKSASTVPATRGALVDRVFGFLVSEAVACGGCGKRTHVVAPRMEHAHTYAAAALRLLGAAGGGADGGGGGGLGALLRELAAQDRKTCDRDEGGCGRLQSVTRTLHRCPGVFAMQLAWGGDEGGEEIAGCLSRVTEHLDAADVYSEVRPDAAGGNGGAGGAAAAPSSTAFRLSSMVCYYGQHYMALVKDRRLGQWVLFDDASASAVGDWAAVVRKCAAGRILPSVLLFTAYDPATAAAAAEPAAAAVPAAAAPLAAAPPAASAPGFGAAGAAAAPAPPAAAPRPAGGGGAAARPAVSSFAAAAAARRSQALPAQPQPPQPPGQGAQAGGGTSGAGRMMSLGSVPARQASGSGNGGGNGASGGGAWGGQQ